MAKQFAVLRNKIYVSFTLLGIMAGLAVSQNCTAKQFTFKGIDDQNAMLELERFLEDQARNGRIISIKTEITGLENSADTTTNVDITPTPTVSTEPPTKVDTTTSAGSATSTTVTDSPMTTSYAEFTELENCVTDRTRGAANVSSLRTSCQRIDSGSGNVKAGGGAFHMDITGIGKTEVYCDNKTEGGGWIVFQRRIDGSVDFNRNWTEYANGFGNVTEEFWLGLEKMHRLTDNKDCELRIDMIRNTSVHYYAKYSGFRIKSESDKYKLNIGKYSGNATDSLKDTRNTAGQLNNQPFSTKDSDNDGWERDCSKQHKCGWWFNACKRACLNSKYERINNYGITWMDQFTREWMKMKFTEMKLRC